MESQLNRSNPSERYVKIVFSNMLDDNIKNAFSYINANLPMGPIRIINVYLTSIDKFLHESNDIDKTTRELENIKNYVSQFSAHITNYNTRIRSFLITRLDRITRSESTIKKLNNGNGIYSKYEKIKPKIVYCKSSLEFEVQRLESISKNAKMLQKQLEFVIGMLNKHKKNMEKLEEFKRKLETLKKIVMNYITRAVQMVICNLFDIERISNSLKFRIRCVTITTIKQDVDNIYSSIKDINNILSTIKPHLDSLLGFKLEIDCKLVNEIESCIVGIVCGIHCKYCCLSSTLTQFFSGQQNSVPTLGDCCQLSKTLECATTAPTCSSAQTCTGQKGPQTCGTCQDCQSDQGCQFCESLNQLLSSCSESDIKQKLDSINKIICKLTDGKAVDGCNSGSGDKQCPHSCDTSQPQASNSCPTTSQGGQTTNTCKETNIRQLIECTVSELEKCQSSLVKCESKEEVKCEQTTGAKPTQTTSCSTTTTSSTKVNCNELAKLKLCVDTVINKCNCTQLRQMLNNGKIKSFVGVLKWVLITNFRELFSLYTCFDKSILDQIPCSINKLDDITTTMMNMYLTGFGIKYRIDGIKDEINQLTKKVESLEITIKSGIRQLECAIEGVPRNLVRCSLQSSINNSTFKVIINIYHNKLDN